MGRLLALLAALIAGAWIAFVNEQLPESQPVGAPLTEFAGERAFADVNFMAAVPHPLGSPDHDNVRDALMGRMLKLGLSPQVRPGVGVNLPRGATDLIVAGPVENVVGILPGRDRGAPALALMAHYDSVPASPGAADDMLGVATALETVRAIKARGTPARDVMLVITDGEEAGLLGANHFFRRDPLATRVGLVINMEARGDGGRVQMFQTSPNNGELIGLFQHTAQRPASSSLAVLIYEKMPNDTDLTETLRAGTTGLNYAIIGKQFDYHSPTSTPANLDRGSLQDMGTQVLALASEIAFSNQLPGRSPSAVYSNLFGDTLVAYPAWFGWVLLIGVAGLLAVSIRWARHAGQFEAKDILRGMGALAFLGLGTVAVLEFARRLTGAESGYLEQRFLLAQANRWEWAVMLISLGVMLIAAAELSRTRRWVVLLPVVAGAACSVFGHLDLTGAIAGGLASAIGYVTYGKPVNRKGAWAGILALGLLLAVAVQIVAPGAGYVLAWPLLVGAVGAATTALGAKRGILPLILLAVLAAVSLGWQGGLSHFAFEGMDLMALFGVPMLTAAFVIWPLAQPDPGRSPSRYIGILVLAGGLALTAFARSADPWTPRHPLVTYVGYQLDQDTGKAWRFGLASDLSAWTDQVLGADGGRKAPRSHWSWRRPMLAAPARPMTAEAPATALYRLPDGTLRFDAATPTGARTLALQLRASTPANLTGLNGVPTELALPAGKWVRIYWQAPGHGLSLAIRPSQAGRLDVRYVAGFDRWPGEAVPLPPRPSDLMAWDDSDSTFVTGTRAYAW
ncbi:M20/M25/M40 family metallo-hydrolase [Phenylobacterium sp.]|uniref:M20/M25/M40 family metallo-hydrolase n=1 Tax=Phenylobacterium sp. TaxID=1871053 RepID=UPI0025DAB638|nr:M20/M25/M40 family metallo-hydrolase [Phenylobacterium sp.]